MSDWNEKVISEFRANQGRVGGSFEGAPLLLLRTTGARAASDRVLVTGVTLVAGRSRCLAGRGPARRIQPAGH